jgi:hypothetical protein
MSGAYPTLRSLDPYHARVGYLGALASVGIRALDRQDALMARYHELLYRRIFPEDPRFEALMSRVAPARREELLKRRFRPEAEDPSAAFSHVAPLNAPPPADWLLAARSKRPFPVKAVNTEWLYVSEFWLHDAAMPSPIGYLPREKADRTLDLARWTEAFLPTLELSETGYLLRHYLAKAATDQSTPSDTFNPLNPAAHACMPLLYFRILLRAEMLLPFLVLELVERSAENLTTRGEGGLLLSAVNRMLGTIGEVSDPEYVNDVRNLTDFQKAISPPKDSTQENYLRPRLENLVDLGFLGRRSARHEKRSDFMWEVTDRTRALASEVRSLAAPTNLIDDFLNDRFFGSWTRIVGGGQRPVTSDEQRLLWFARAFQEIGREFGFTPGRTLALKSCLMAWEGGWIMEVSDVFKAVYGAAQSRFAEFLRFSGGSRFDTEFLIRIEDNLLPELERLVTPSGSSPGGTP